MNHQFSILIPSWNNLEFLKLCIQSIRDNSHFQHQILIHINDGSDGSLDWVKSQSDLSYTHSKENIGVCFALNLLRPLVKTDYMLYMNDDMFALPNWDKFLWDEIKMAKSDYFFYSSTMIEPIRSSNCVIVKDYGNSIQNFQKEKLLIEYEGLPFQDWYGSTWPPNILPTKLWDLVGGYSVEFSPGMYSDPDFSMKLWMAGVRDFKGISKSRVYHFGSKSVSRVKKNKGYYQFINKWGFTSSFLTKNILKRGEPYQNKDLEEFTIPLKIKLKSFFKRLQAIFILN
ncbi:MAG: hypothetical protein RIR51_591 [Bacteroidota bacterium]